MTKAQEVAKTMGEDGQVYEAPDGRELHDICLAYGAETEHGGGYVEDADPETSREYRQIDPTWLRYVFADGSAIVDCVSGWDIEGSAPWSWEGAERK